MVGCWNSKNSFLTNRSTHDDLPTAASPSNTNLKLSVLPKPCDILVCFCFVWREWVSEWVDERCWSEPKIYESEKKKKATKTRGVKRQGKTNSDYNGLVGDGMKQKKKHTRQRQKEAKEKRQRRKKKSKSSHFGTEQKNWRQNKERTNDTIVRIIAKSRSGCVLCLDDVCR